MEAVEMDRSWAGRLVRERMLCKNCHPSLRVPRVSRADTTLALPLHRITLAGVWRKKQIHRSSLSKADRSEPLWFTAAARNC